MLSFSAVQIIWPRTIAPTLSHCTHAFNLVNGQRQNFTIAKPSLMKTAPSIQQGCIGALSRPGTVPCSKLFQCLMLLVRSCSLQALTDGLSSGASLRRSAKFLEPPSPKSSRNKNWFFLLGIRSLREHVFTDLGSCPSTGLVSLQSRECETHRQFHERGILNKRNRGVERGVRQKEKPNKYGRRAQWSGLMSQHSTWIITNGSHVLHRSHVPTMWPRMVVWAHVPAWG